MLSSNNGCDFILLVHAQDMASYQTMVIEKRYMLSIVDHLKTLSVTQILKDKPLYL
ncbi:MULTISPECIES: hypothetical protein [Candidatus Cardinium]|uniref:hypothetical protein n=1 Tax=Candidatus Cardinium TaxID=273135 RepID=UPI001FAAEB4A|nr:MULTISPECIES: hypothetical protein [Cardinium]